jgi:hypothetical protein
MEIMHTLAVPWAAEQAAKGQIDQARESQRTFGMPESEDQRMPASNHDDALKLEGGCYCGALRYVAEGTPLLKGQCHCRECQYISGGAPHMFMLMPSDGFRYVKGQPRRFTRSDLERPVTREFCAECGTHLITRRPGIPAVILKVGTLDDPSLFGAPQMAIFTVDKQAFHQIPEGLPTFERMPTR